MKECFQFYSQIPASSEQYDEFMGTGLDEADSYVLANALRELKPLSGKTSVSTAQKMRAVVDADLSVKEQLAALKTITGESLYRKLETANSMGISPSEYTKVYENLYKYDADGNGSYSNAEIKAAIDAVATGDMLPGSGLTALNLNKKAILWQLLTGSKSSKNNPYSTSAGNKVLAALGG